MSDKLLTDTRCVIVAGMDSVEITAEAAALALAREQPEIGQFRAARELRERGITLSPSGIRAIWKRHGLETAYQRLMARKRGSGRGDEALSETQAAKLERARVSRRVLSASGREADPQGSIRKDQLIAAAARVFGTKGYESASLREICAAAGILAGSLYYHFRSKEDLFVTVHAEGFQQLNAAVDAALEGLSDPWGRLEAACAAHLRELVGGNDIMLVTGTSLFQAAKPALQRRLNAARDAYEERYRALIEAVDLVPGIDRSLLRLTLLGALNWTRTWYRPGGRTPEAIAAHLVQNILRRTEAA